MTSVELLNNEFNAIRLDLIRKHDELNMRASGKWASSLEVEVSGNGSITTARLLGEKYTKQLINGREPGKFPPLKAIEQWIKDKGIQGMARNISVSSLAFLIARKIAKEGTRYYQKGGTDLVESVITPERIQQIIDKVSEINLNYIVNGLVEQLKEVA